MVVQTNKHTNNQTNKQSNKTQRKQKKTLTLAKSDVKITGQNLSLKGGYAHFNMHIFHF